MSENIKIGDVISVVGKDRLGLVHTIFPAQSFHNFPELAAQPNGLATIYWQFLTGGSDMQSDIPVSINSDGTASLVPIDESDDTAHPPYVTDWSPMGEISVIPPKDVPTGIVWSYTRK